MALNRGLYKSLGTNLVQAGTMKQRWLLGTAAGTINTATNEYGQTVDPTVGRGLLLTDTGAGVVFPVGGRFNVTLQPGNSVVDFVSAKASFTKYGIDPAFIAVSEQFKPTGVTFQTWHLDASPNQDRPGVSVAGSVGALAAVSGPFCGTNGTLTTLGGVAVTATSALTSQAVSGLTATLTFGAAAPTNATALISGRGYTITTLGTTDFTLYGASSNTIGTSFVATAVGLGTGTCITQQVTGVVLSTSTPDILALLAPYGDAAASTTWTLQLPRDCGGGVGVVCNPVAALATTAVLAPNPCWLSVEVDFTMSTVPA